MITYQEILAGFFGGGSLYVLGLFLRTSLGV
jgi:hypothetical protein